jgi:hypothetical protein
MKAAADTTGGPREMGCEEAGALLPLVADGALDAEADPALFAHLARCCDCQEALMRHDLVGIALEATRPPQAGEAARRRALIRHVFLPWPAALAASLAAATGLWMWLASLQQHPPVVSPAPEVVQVLGADGQPIYVVMKDGQMTVVDPRAIDGKAPAVQPQVTPVRFAAPKP